METIAQKIINNFDGTKKLDKNEEKTFFSQIAQEEIQKIFNAQKGA